MRTSPTCNWPDPRHGREIGLRAALGASRFRIARQLITESVVIAFLGGGLGLCVAAWNLRLTKAGIPVEVLRWVAGLRTMHMDWSIALGGLALSAAAGIACCLPAIYRLLHARNGTGLTQALKEGQRSSSPGPSSSRARSTLVVVEVAPALVLLVGAGLMVRTFQRMLAGCRIRS